jgi:hypothetical protein
VAATTALGLALVPAQPAGAVVDKIGFGFPESHVNAVQAEGAKLTYSTSWAVGGDISGVDNALAAADASGTIPVVHWYYWGDAISRTCVDNFSDTTVCKDGRTRQKWNNGATALADTIHQFRPGRQTVVTLELEFHKSGLDAYEPLDGYLETQANLLKKYPGEVTVVLGWGEWAQDTTYNAYDRAQAASQWAGTQILYSCIRQNLTDYRAAVSQTIANAGRLKAKFGKPVFVYDWALSSYSEASSGDTSYSSTNPDFQCVNDSPLTGGYATEQKNVVAEIFSRKQELKANDVVGFVFRALDDHSTRAIWNSDGTYKDYHRIAERWFGFRHDGVEKPAFATVIQGIKDEAGSGGTPPPSGTSEWKGEAESFATKTTGGQCSYADASGGLCWNIWANGSISTTTSSLTAGTKTVTVVAHGDPAGGIWPTMEVRVDGTLVKTASVADDVWLPYSTSVSLGAGTHTIQVSYTNDGSVDGNDRNLLVDYATFTGQSSQSWMTQAEAFTTKTAGGLVTSSGASGGQYWNLWANGYIENAMTVPSTGTHDVEVVARGDVAGGVWPTMKVWVDGVLIRTQTVSVTAWTSYRTPYSLSAGTHTLRVEFTNDAIVGTEDRNLKLDYAALYS